MRLLAYGGTSYLERYRIGDWPSILEGALSDTYLLSVQEIRFGVGLLQDQSPFLILRQRQHIENRGGYAFTLLLDPGTPVWETFEWNGAALADCILKDQTGRMLLSAPEEVSERQVTTMLENLTYEPNRSDPEWTRFHSFWVGAMLEQDPVIASPKHADLDQWPQLDKTADLLSRLLPCFRCGFGWLMGGSKEQGAAFGAQLVFDINAPDVLEIEAMIEDGERASRALEKVSTDPVVISKVPQWSKRLSIESARPVHLWQTPDNEPVQVYLRGVIALADKFKSAPGLSKPSGYRGTGLNEALAVGALHAALLGSDQLDDARTLIVLSNVFEGKFVPEQKDVSRLKSDVIVDELGKRGLRPIKPDIPMELSVAVRIEAWRKLIETEEDTRLLPARLKDAVSDLHPPVQARELDQSKLTELGELAIKQTSLKNGNLRIWTESLRDGAIAPLIREPLHQVSMTAVASAINTEVVLDYLAFGNDIGGNALLDLNVSGANATKIVELIFSEFHKGKLREEALIWLMALADSPFRLAVSLDSKMILATEFTKKWGNLIVLWKLHSGQPDALKEATPISDFERKALHQELADMVNEERRLSVPPDLHGITQLLGELSNSEIDALHTRRKPRDFKSASRWLAGWKSLNREDIYQSELVRLLLLENRLPEGFLLSTLSDESLNTLIVGTLTGDPEDATRLPRLKSLLLKKNEEARLAAALKAHLEKVAVRSERPAVLIQFLQAHRLSRDLLFESLDYPAQEQLLMHLAAEDENGLVERTYKIYREALVSMNPLSVFERATLQFLHSPKGKKIRNQISSQHLSPLDGDIDKNLRILLGESDSGSASNQEATNKDPKGFWNSIKDWYHSFD